MSEDLILPNSRNSLNFQLSLNLQISYAFALVIMCKFKRKSQEGIFYSHQMFNKNLHKSFKKKEKAAGYKCQGIGMKSIIKKCNF